MPVTIDARGLACPQPVILTNRALAEGNEMTVIVDNEAAKENVSRLARSKGFRLRVEEKDGEFYLHLSRESAEEAPVSAGTASGPTVLLVASDSFGRGNDELGQLLMRSFFHTLGEVSPQPDKVILANSGVRLAVEGSEALDDLRSLEERGIDILACGTCLGYYGLKEKLAAGQVSNMYDIASALLNAGRLIEL